MSLGSLDLAHLEMGPNLPGLHLIYHIPSFDFRINGDSPKRLGRHLAEVYFWAH